MGITKKEGEFFYRIGRDFDFAVRAYCMDGNGMFIIKNKNALSGGKDGEFEVLCRSECTEN